MESSEGFVGHKFRSLDVRCWESLESSEFYFPKPEKLNDPADCQIDFSKAYALARAGQTEKSSI